MYSFYIIIHLNDIYAMKGDFMKVIGMRKFEYTSKKTGNTFPAANLYVTEERNNVVGLSCFDIFVRAELVPPELTVGDEVRCSYNRFGRVESIDLVR